MFQGRKRVATSVSQKRKQPGSTILTSQTGVTVSPNNLTVQYLIPIKPVSQQNQRGIRSSRRSDTAEPGPVSQQNQCDITAEPVSQENQCYRGTNVNVTAEPVSQENQCSSGSNINVTTEPVSQQIQCHNRTSVTAEPVSQEKQCHSRTSITAEPVLKQKQCRRRVAISRTSDTTKPVP